MTAAATAERRNALAGDIDGFVALFVDNLVQVLLLLALCSERLGLPTPLLHGRVVVGVLLSVAAGNFYFAWAARRVDGVAPPYGISTVSLFGNGLLVLLPAAQALRDAGVDAAVIAREVWGIGMAAAFTHGVLVALFGLVAPLLQRLAPRVALLTPLAGIGLAFLGVDFLARCFSRPWVGLVPLTIIVIAKLAGRRSLGPVPVALGALTAGSLIAVWQGPALTVAGLGPSLSLPLPYLGELMGGLASPYFQAALLPVLVPLALTNALGTAQNLEAARAAGDALDVRSGVVANGLLTMLGAVFGGCVATTIYVGHAGFKELGARRRYSAAHGVAMLSATLFGLAPLVAAVVPAEAGAGILVWIGVAVLNHTLASIPAKEWPVMLLALLPAVARWACGQVQEAARLAAVTAPGGAAWQAVAERFHGLATLGEGFMLTGMVWAAAGAAVQAGRSRRAAGWLLSGAGLSLAGLMHGPSFAGVSLGSATDLDSALGWGLGYSVAAGIALVLGSRRLPAMENSGG
ncbi:MAG: hypothetical protein HY903_09525 [Deltaproteobacteria bacterium]|nr:hypothetical protein [Deltaproteobacteria bacterium]